MPDRLVGERTPGLPHGVCGITGVGEVGAQPGDDHGVGIDPRLFRAFQVSEVPAYVVTASDFDLCSGFDCTSAVPPYDRMNGNVTAEYALRTIAEGDGHGARIAAQHLARLQGDQP